MAIQYWNNINSNGKAAINSVNNLANQATQKASEATSSVKSGLDTLLAADPTESTTKIRGYGDQISGIAGNMSGYVDSISPLAKNLTDTASTLTSSGNDILGIGTDLTNMNRDSSNEYVRTLLANIDQYSPDNYVSLAAQDVNNSYDTGNGQLLRTMSRQGVNASSGRSAALQQQYQIARNTALAAAKTRARLSGLTAQTGALQTLANIGQSYTNQGKDFLTSAATVTGNAIGAYNTMASIEKTSADLLGSAASLEQSATNIDLGYAGSVASQYNTLGSSQRSEASLLDSQSARELGFIENVMQQETALAQAAMNNSQSVYEDFYGNRIYSKNGNATVVNKASNLASGNVLYKA